MSRKNFLFSALLSALAFTSGTGLTIASGWLITMASQQPPILTLTVAIVGVRFFGISRSALRYGERISSHSAVFNALTRIRSELFDVISKLPVTATRKIIVGSFAKTIVDDVERAQEYQLRNRLPQLSALISVSLGALVGAWISPSTLIVTFPVFILFFGLIPYLVSRWIFPPSFHVEDSESELADSLSVTMGELQEGEIFGYYDQLIFRSKEKIDDIAVKERGVLKRVSYVQSFALTTLALAIVGSIYVSRNLVNPPSVRITMVIFIPLVIYEAVNSWYPSLFTSAKLLRSQRSVESILRNRDSQPSQAHQPEGFLVKAEGLAVSWGLNFMTAVDFQASPDSPLLISGENGSGKSTLALGILGLLPYQGSIRVCGAEVRELSNNEDFVASSLQDSHVFNTSIRENLKIGNPQASDEMISEVLRLLELDYISLDELVGEFGRILSGGESKRLAVGRALLSQAPVVILDEPLEHLDEKRAQRIEKRILSYLYQRTLIVIAHNGWEGLENTLVMRR